MDKISWDYKHFNALTTKELYAILQVRSAVFVVEQACPYLDPDGKDEHCYHLTGWLGDTVVAYVRILPPGLAYPDASIGRVLTNPAFRRSGAGRELMNRAIQMTFDQFQTTRIHIGAQLYLKDFYSSLGFRQSGPEYLEDNIPHIEMLLSK